MRCACWKKSNNGYALRELPQGVFLRPGTEFAKGA